VKKALALLVLLAMLGAALIVALALQPFRGYSSSVIVAIPAGAGARQAAKICSSRGVLRTSLPFLALYALGRPRGRTLKAGEYLFDRPLSARQVYWKLVRGDVYYHVVLIPEGSDRFDMARILHDKLSLNPQAFLQATLNTELIRDLDPQASTLEGYLFPDTYRFPASTTAASAVQTIVVRFRQVAEARITPQLDGRSLHDVLTLASLVEKETPNPAERPQIAGVFVRRLEQGMLLDCDPTVVYAARLDMPLSDAPASGPPSITADQLNSASPYNTYRHAGMPPGPICSPGEASIEGALHPAAGTALYFVSNLHGGHVFASTLAEHNRNVARYRRQAAEAARSNN
jgi:UPF0755 protein